MNRFLLFLVALQSFCFAVDDAIASPYAQWKNGPSTSPDFFPIAVWVQDPRNAKKYKDAGINTYVALWGGPTDAQLDALEKAGMNVVCHQNEVGLKNKDRKVIIAWMHGDEPDNAQAIKGEKGWGPPILPSKIVEDYEKVRAADPTRPVLLNLGQGVAYDNYIGRGVRRNKLEDYPEYIKGSDIVSFDIYPVTHEKPEIAGNLWYVAKGVDRLRQWGSDKKIVWDCIECTHISNPDKKATPDQVKTMVWMSLIHGARGLIYFSHQFKPTFIEAGMLADAEMTKGIAAINKQITELAPMLNSASLKDAASVTSSAADAPVDILVKKHGDQLYIFAVNMRDVATTAAFTIKAPEGYARAKEIGAMREIEIKDGKFSDEMKGYAVRLFKCER